MARVPACGEAPNALGYKTYNDIKEIIRILQAEGRTILMTSHNYDDLETLCTQIYAIDEGDLSVLSGAEMKKRFRGCAEIASFCTHKAGCVSYRGLTKLI